MKSRLNCALALLALCVAVAHAVRPVSEERIQVDKKDDDEDKTGPTTPFVAPLGFFIQERASKQLPGPGQHFQFGALKNWEDIHEYVSTTPNTKLLLLVRHGQALSNWLQETLGPDEWWKVEDKCTYDNRNGTVYGVFDAELTPLGEEQGAYLNSILKGGGWWERMVGNLTARAVVSPLSRCLNTALLAGADLPIRTWSVEEHVRETLGEDTCDARRSVTDPDPRVPVRGPCQFQRGLRSKFPMFKFPVVSSSQGEGENGGLGLISDADILWTKDRETQKEQVKRATRFLYNLFAYADEKVAIVFTHSGFTRSVLLAVEREPYRPQNTELVPIIVTKVE